MDRGLNIPKVKDILTRKVIAFEPEYFTVDVIHAFNKHRISSAPIVNQKDEVIGFISQADLMKYAANCLFYDEQCYPIIRSLMSNTPLAAKQDWDILKLDQFFLSNKLRSCPVVDNENHLMGMVAQRDILRALETLIHQRSKYKKNIKTPIELNLIQRMKLFMKKS